MGNGGGAKKLARLYREARDYRKQTEAVGMFRIKDPLFFRILVETVLMKAGYPYETIANMTVGEVMMRYYALQGMG